MGRPRGVVESKPLPQIQLQAAPHSIPGVLILGIAREPLYVTPSAHKLLVELNGVTNAPWGSTALPLAVQQVCTELQHNEKRDPAGTDWDTMQARHLARTDHGTILIRGYGIVDRHHSAQTGRFLILLEAVPTESLLSDTDVPKDFQFTERQRSILNGLDRGLTNKEIAVNMLISVHTVKEHIRQLMIKLHTTSRTGIVAQVARLTLPSLNPPPKSADRRTAQASQATVQRA
jgi:DNA-binding CsgD family transcriptional regulator